MTANRSNPSVRLLSKSEFQTLRNLGKIQVHKIAGFKELQFQTLICLHK
ncbi:hypothetical protein GNIT_1251 [Glaciecola nitratireducens FR1064]|uniref:Uncharacterized protein n=1 Tax=Glaciecola nitratireducens (strain JCM 12485 / KCTC 12276 / FR1064) TaxID=1085623 RepID=G4QKY5_GLANF|nr:hypothetical protein GNIT_1251 [Glaciecola nitratireducens FR1064]